MAKELIDHYIDRDGIRKDTEFMLAELNRLLDGIKGLQNTNFAFKDIKSSKELTAYLKEATTAQAALEASTRRLAAAQELLKNSRDLTVEKQQLAQRNKELKASVELELASANSINEARARVKQLTIERDSLNLATEQGIKRQKELNAEIDKNNAFIKENVDAYQKQKINIGNYEGSAKIIVDALQKVEDKITSLKAKQIELQNLSSANPIGFKLGGGSDSLNQVTAELRQATEQAESLRNVTSEPKFLNLAGKVGDARMEVRGFTTSLIQLEQQGFGNSEVANELRKRLAELTDQIGDTRAEIKALSSDTRSFDLFASGVNTAVSVMQTAVGVTQLLGEENEDTAKSIQTMLAVQNIANGVREIANELTERGTLANKAYAFTQGLIATATNTSATATARLGAALKLLGIGLVLGGIAYLVVKMQEWSKASKEAAARQNVLNDMSRAAADSYGSEKAKLDVLIGSIKQEGLSRKQKMETLQQLKDAYPGYFDNIKTEQDLVDKLPGAYERAAKGILLKAKAQAGMEMLGETSKKRLQAELDYTESISEGYEKMNRAIINTGGKFVKDQQLDFQRTTKAASQDYLKVLKDLKATESVLLNSIIGSNAEIDKLGGKIDGNKEKKEKVDKDAIKSAEERRKALYEIRKREIQDEIDLQTAFAESTVIGEIRAMARRQQFESEVKAIEEERKFELGAKNLTEEQKRVIEDDARRKTIEAEIRLNSDILTIRKSFNDEIKAEGEAQYSALQNQQNAAKQKQIDDLTGGFEKEQRLFEKAADMRLTVLNNEYAAGKIDKETFEKQKQKIENEYLLKSLNGQVAYYSALVTLYENDVDKKAEALGQLAAIQKKIAETGAKSRQEEIDDYEKIKNALIDLGKELNDTFFSILSAGVDRQKNAVQEQMDDLDRRKEKEIEIIEQTVKGEEEKAAKIAVLNARTQAEREALERRQRALDEKKARYERARMVMEIIGNTAIAVTKALPNVFLAAVIGAMGALQLVKLLTTPIPKFKHGKDRHNLYEGPAWVGDGGKSEAIMREDGSVEITPDSPTLSYVKSKDIILPDASQILDGLAMRETSKVASVKRLDKQDHQQVKQLEKAIHGMRKDVVHAIHNIPQPHIETPNPIRKWVRDGNTTLKI